MRVSTPTASLFGKYSQDSPPPKGTSMERAGKASATIPTDRLVLHAAVPGILLAWWSEEGRRAQVGAVGDWG